MSDYIDEYGDEIESVESRLQRSLELLAVVREYLDQDLPRKALRELPEAMHMADHARVNIRGLMQSLEYDTTK